MTFCTMLTGSALATGIAAPATLFAMGEQTRRAATAEWQGGWSPPSHRRLRFCAAATLADFTSGMASEALGGHASVVGWKRGTLVPTYRKTVLNLTDETVAEAALATRAHR